MKASSEVLVTGGTGLIGHHLVDLLVQQGEHVRVASLDDPHGLPDGVEFLPVDLRDPAVCSRVCSGIRDVYHLAGIKGSPSAAHNRPASFFTPLLLLNTAMMEAAFRAGVDRYLYTSTIGVYGPAEVLREDEAWSQPPSKNDRFAGWAKRMGELQAEAYEIEHGWRSVAIVRPANVYGPWDDFRRIDAMVVPSIIRRAVESEGPFVVWGDGSPVRDFVHARDVARGMIAAMKLGLGQGPINLGSGIGTSIRRLAEIVTATVSRILQQSIQIKWKPSSGVPGDVRRVMSVEKAERILGWKAEISIEDGIDETMSWYAVHRHEAQYRHDPFLIGAAK